MVINLFNKDKKYLPKDTIGKYTVLESFGEGRFGICYKVIKDDKLYVLKQLKRKMLKKSGFKSVFEYEILSKIDHKCIPKFIEKLEYEDFVGYVLEYKEGKTFEEIIFKDNYVFQKEEIYDICLQLINILEYLHSMGVVHRDIRVPNTLYNSGTVILIDFGLARWINDKRYTVDVDFSFLGDFLLHLYYTSFEVVGKSKKVPWYEELSLPKDEMRFLKRLFGLEQKYSSIDEVKRDLKSFRKC